MSGKDFSTARLLRSFGYAFKGIVTAYKNGQVNIRIHTLIACIALILGLSLSVSTTEWIVIILCIGLVISAEIVNSALEKLVDMISPEWNKQAGQVKDMAAGAVLVLAIAALIVGCIIFLPKII